MHELYHQKSLKTEFTNKKAIEQYKIAVRKLLIKKKEAIHKELDKYFTELVDYVHDNFSLFSLQGDLRRLS